MFQPRLVGPPCQADELGDDPLPSLMTMSVHVNADTKITACRVAEVRKPYTVVTFRNPLGGGFLDVFFDDEGLKRFAKVVADAQQARS